MHWHTNGRKTMKNIELCIQSFLEKNSQTYFILPNIKQITIY